MAVPVPVPVAVAAVDSFKDLTTGLFQSIAVMHHSNNQRKVAIENIRAEVNKYLASLDADLQKSMKLMTEFRQLFETELDKTDLSFSERKSLLEIFVDAMLKAAGR